MDDGDYDAAKKMIDEAIAMYGDGALLDSLLRQMEPATESLCSETETEEYTDNVPSAPETASETDDVSDDFDFLFDEDLDNDLIDDMDDLPDIDLDALLDTDADLTEYPDMVLPDEGRIRTEPTTVSRPSQTPETTTRAYAASAAGAETHTAKPSASTWKAAAAADRVTQTQPETTTVSAVTERTMREQALDLAKVSKKQTALSRTRMIEQIREKGFSEADAVYAADHCGADWNIQAFKAAKKYAADANASGRGCSRDELKKALRQAGFSEIEASYAVDRICFEQNAQAEQAAQNQASGGNTYDYEALKAQLLENGLSEIEADDAAGLVGIGADVPIDSPADV